MSIAAPSTEAAVRSPFDRVFSTDENGAIAIIGNSQMTCPTAANGCTTARAGSAGNLNNNNYVMGFLDTDSVAATTNSTSADLAMPAGSEVLYARLLWGGRLTAGTNGVAGSGSPGVAKFRAPGQSAYSTITASQLVRPGLTGTDADPYQAALDVTDIVQQAGNGTYGFADVVAATGNDRYAGWSLIVAYRNSSLPLRNLSVFQGFADITTESTANSSVSTTVSGFLTPATGTVNATVGMVGWEGDLGTTGDVLKFNGTTLSDSQRPANNSFDSRITDLGANTTARDNNNINNFGVDMGRISASGILSNGQTSATVAASTTGDYIYLGALTTEIDLYTPSFAGVSKSVTNLNGNSPAKVGDTLEYRLNFTNSGQDYADNVVARDVLPANVTYVPGSMAIVTGPNAGSVTDAADVDAGEYVAADRLVRIRLGSGSTNTTGGTIPVSGNSSAVFRATLDRASAGSTVTNGGLLDYRARTLGRDYTFTTNTVSTQVQAIADLGVTLASSPTSQSAGTQVTYTQTVVNNGPAASTNVVTTNTLPAGASYVSSNPPAGTTCSVADQVVTCRTASLAVGASVAIPIVAGIAPGTAAGSLVDQASVTSDTTDDVTSNNTATTTTTVTRSADLGITMSAPGSVVAGATVTYNLTVTNAGPSSATGASISDTLPVGVTLVSTNPSQGTCSADSQTVSCALGAIAPGDTATVQVVGRVSAAYAGASVGNTATVTSSVPDPVTTNNSAQATTTVTRNTDLTVTQTATPTSVTAGNTMNFVVNVANAGTSDANGVSITDTLPSGVTVLSVTPTQGTCSSATSSVSCSLGVLTPGTSARVTVLARVAAGTAAGNLTATATGTTTTPETNTANNTGAVTFAVVSRADLSLAMTANPDPVIPGSNLTYTLRATNGGPSQATGVTFVDTLPAGTTFVAAGSSSDCTASGQTVTCVVGTVASGAVAERTIVVSTPATLPGGSLVNNATVNSTDDPDTSNNQASFSSSLEPQADLAVTGTASPGSVVAGNPVRFTLTAANNGPATATDVTVTDTVPASVAVTSVTATGGGTCSRTGQTVTCTFASLAAGATPTITIVGTVGTDTSTGTISNSATIGATAPGDPTTSNNTATTSVNVTRNADIGITLEAVTPTVRAGEEATYRVTVSNAGPSTSRNVVVTGVVPDGLDPVAGSSGGACTVSGRTVTCPVALLPAGASSALTFRALVRPSTPAGTIAGSASIGATTPDSNTTNNSDPESITVTTAADLQAGESVTPGTLTAGGTAVYTLTATNAGPSDATSVTLSNTFPTGLTVQSVDPSAGSCTVTGQTVSCTAPRLAPGGVLTVRVGVAVDPDLTGPVSTTTTVGSAVTDPAPGNDSATTSSPVGASSDLRLGLTASPASAVAGSALTYTLTAVNTGPSTADGVVLRNTLPPGVQITADQISAPAGVTCTVAGRVVTCALGDLAPGASATVTLVSVVPAGVADGTDLVDEATLTSPTPTDNPGGRAASVTTPVSTSADLAITMSSQSSSPIAGTTETYVLSVVNRGPSVARAVELTDVLPSTMTFDSAVNPAGSCSAASGDVVCDLGAIGVGEVVTIRITANVDPAAGGQDAANAARVTSPTSDPNGENNSAQLSLPVSAQNDLDIAKQVTSGPIVAGQDTTYRITVTNNGPSLARQVTVLDQIPDGLGYVSATAAGSGACLYEELASTPADDDRIRCTFDRLAVGDSTYADLVVSVPATLAAGTTVSNTATAASSAVDPTPATATVTGTVGTSADVSAIKTLLSGPPIAGEEIRWQVEVSNAGPSVARDVTLTDPNPTGVTLASAQTAQGSCTVDADGADCALGDLASGGLVVVTLSGTVGDAFTGTSLDNTATVDSPTADPRPGNNSSDIATPVSARADLRVTTASTTPTATAGSEATWTVTVTNNGPSTATQVVIGDTLPAGVTLVSQSLAGPGTCVAQPAIRCTVPSLAPGASAVLTVVGSLDSGYPGTAVTNDATATSAVPDPNPLDNSDTSSTPVARRADVAVTMTAPARVTAGTAIQWQVTVANSGPSDASGVVLSDQVPPGVLSATGSFAGGSCQLTSGVVTCPVGIVPAGGQVVVTVDGTVAPGVVADSLENQASATASTPDPTTGDLSASATTAVDRSSDLSVNAVATTDLVAGQPAAWGITVDNAGPSVAQGVDVTYVLPAGVGQITTDTPGCTVTGQTVTCTAASLAPGASLQIVVRGVFDPALTAASLAPTASVSSDTADPDGSNDQTTASAPVTRSADLATTMQITSGVPAAGAPIVYQVRVTNRGPSVARGVQLVDDLPAQVGQVTATSPDGTCTVADGSVTCDLGALAVDATAVVTISGVLSQDVGSDLANTATATATTPDPDESDNSASAEGSVDGVADLGVTATAPATVVAGTDATWTIVVTNAGPSVARSSTLTDVLPVGVGNVRVVAPAGVVCTPAVGCTLGDLDPGQSVTIRVTATVDPDVDGTTLVNKATVDSATADPSSVDQDAVSETAVTASADLTVSQTSDPPLLTPGTDSTYTLTVANAGPSSARQVQLRQRLPEGMTLVGTGPTGDRGTCTVSGRDITCTVAVLAPGDSTSFQVPVQLDSAYPSGQVASTATVSALTPDPDGSNNSSTLTSTAAPRADLTLVQNVPGQVVAGTPLTWELELSNDGPSDARDVVITQSLPVGVGQVYLSPEQGVCGQSGRTITCSLGRVASGSVLRVRLGTVGNLDPSFVPGSITNTATVTSPTPDPGVPDPFDGDGRTDAAPTVVQAIADVRVIMVPTSSTALAGGPVGWLVTVVNEGPSTAQDVVLSNPAIAGVTGLTIVPPPGVTCTAARVCTIGTMLPGADNAVSFRVSGTLSPTYADTTVVDTATATASTTDDDDGDNRASAPVIVGRAAGVSIVVSPSSPVAVPGGRVQWNVVVHNGGPSAATGVEFSDVIPDGVTGLQVDAPARVTCTGTATLTCTIGGMPVGTAGDVTVTISGVLDPDYQGGTLVNTADVVSTSPDPALGDNSSTATQQVLPGADLAITMTADRPSAVAGQRTSWTLRVTNAGPATARSVTVTDPAPAGVRLIPPAGCTVTGGVLACSLGTLAPGATRVLHLTGVLDPTVPGALTNVATVDAASGDPDPSDNVATVTIPVRVSADLVIDKRVDRKRARTGSVVTYTVRVTNRGPSDVTRVGVRESWPRQLSLLTFRSSQGSYDAPSGGWNVGTLPLGRTATLTLRARVVERGTVSNTARLVGTAVATDPGAANNSDVARFVARGRNGGGGGSGSGSR